MQRRLAPASSTRTGSPTSSAPRSVDYAVVELVRASLEAGSSDNVTVVVADVVDTATAAADDGAAASTGPMLVGAAAEQPRRTPVSSRLLPRPSQWRHR